MHLELLSFRHQAAMHIALFFQAVVKENIIIEPYQLVVGVPAKIVKKLPETILEQNINWAGKYVKLAKIHKEHQSM